MNVYIVIRTYFNGVDDSQSVAAVCSSVEKARETVKRMTKEENEKRNGSSYADKFDCDEKAWEIE